MKISFPNWSLHGSSINRRITWCVVSIICLLAGSYLVGRYLGLLVVLFLVVAGTVISTAVRARLNSNNSGQQETAPSWTDTPQITAGWDYRPRRTIRRRVDLHPAAESAKDANSSRSAANENVWFNSLDCSAVYPEPTIEDATAQTPLSDCADVVSMYDQSLIDNRGVATE